MARRFPGPASTPSLLGLAYLLIINAVTICGVVLYAVANDRIWKVTIPPGITALTLICISALYALMSYYTFMTGKRPHNGVLLSVTLIHIVLLIMVIAALNDLLLLAGLVPPVTTAFSAFLPSARKIDR